MRWHAALILDFEDLFAWRCWVAACCWLARQVEAGWAAPFGAQLQLEWSEELPWLGCRASLGSHSAAKSAGLRSALCSAQKSLHGPRHLG